MLVQQVVVPDITFPIITCFHSCSLPSFAPQSRIYRVVTKIPHMEPEDLPPDYLEKLRASLAAHKTCPMAVVGAEVRSGCVELVLDLVSLAEGGAVSADWHPIKEGILDPSVWLQHLHVQPPAGTQVLSQACGR